MSNIVTSLDRYKEIANPDLSAIATVEFAQGSRILRNISPVYTTRDNRVIDKKFFIEGRSVSGRSQFRPRLTKPNFSTISSDKVIVELEQRAHTTKMDHRDLEENTVATELQAMRACSVPVAEALVFELNELLHDDANYVADREVDVAATGTPANDWLSAPTTATPLADIREAIDKFVVSGRVFESDPNITVFIDPKSARAVVNSTEYKTEVNDRRIMEPTLLKDRLEAVLNRRVLLAEGYYYGDYAVESIGDPHFTQGATCAIIYVDTPESTYSDVNYIVTNASTFITGAKDLGAVRIPPQRLMGSNELFHLRGNIAASWSWSSPDGVLENNYTTLMYATVWIHDIRRLVRLKDFIV